ncbi:YdcF family protein [Furfurilactobacillus milii]|uniref:YdcF family protein n=1 Tax=Furfurilactobacillus milii TaxID=2888272 RepID=A0ABT6DE60_9LACO|nr:YdcF family protein [Furfurilactobacillus milii]QLE67340.1 hypothetical protein LROSL2_1990 [Furfurilactobacillus rossiae]MCF6161579.1 YdcF family protein [Furfurilactobacillus milii]MCF6163959.1 YdcF family protein [Furfurilactobacillus milii]MDF9914454.1 YdcF family protein [Furfurilactobacillus milii]QLE69770.1 hypothetical protein LROSL3_1991 [Furfurilactobacillus rossiae]
MFSLSQVTNFLIFFPAIIFIVAVTLAIFGYRHDPRRLLNSWYLVVGAVILLGMPIILLASLSDTHHIGWRILSGLAFLALTLGLFDWIMLINWHFRPLRRHFRALTIFAIILGLTLAVLPFIPAHVWATDLLTPMKYVNTALTLFGAYMCITIADFLVATWTYPRQTKLHGEHYVIVLGSGLHHGDQLSKLLKSRVDTAMRVGSIAKDETGDWPILIMSGGQGADETVSESSAMAAYAKENGYPAAAIRLEEKSTSTFENFQYSLDVIHEPHPTIEFVTNNFHVFRASVFAAMLKLNSRGIAAPTRSHYYHRGLIREYAALTWFHKTRHLLALILIIVLTIAIPWFYG